MHSHVGIENMGAKVPAEVAETCQSSKEQQLACVLGVFFTQLYATA